MTQQDNAAQTDTGNARRTLMGLCAKARPDELATIAGRLAADTDVTPVRGPETGLVMVRGRIGGGGSPFNLGEATMSRASIRLATGEIGHGQRLGTDRAAARHSAIIDAAYQRAEHRAEIESWTSTVQARIDAEARQLAEETAATRVDFFTLVRGDD